jgi:ABC-type transport system involved in multi-copper enzyme maturation permease subunit
MGASAVARYTLVELGRRRLLLGLIGVAIFLTAGIAIAPYVLPGFKSADDRTVFILTGISRVDGVAIELCAFAVGMVVINHDLDSGAIVAILAKPITRFGYAAGKLASSLFLLILVDALFTAGSMLAVLINGGGHMDVMFWFFAASSANALLLMVLVMVLTLYLNNVVAAGTVVAFSFVQTQVSTLHAMVSSNLITGIFAGVINTAYWAVPHQLLSNLERDIATTELVVSCRQGCPFVDAHPNYLADLLARIPGPSGSADIVYWFAYLTIVCAVLYLALRQKQV